MASKNPAAADDVTPQLRPPPPLPTKSQSRVPRVAKNDESDTSEHSKNDEPARKDDDERRGVLPVAAPPVLPPIERLSLKLEGYALNPCDEPLPPTPPRKEYVARARAALSSDGQATLKPLAPKRPPLSSRSSTGDSFTSSSGATSMANMTAMIHRFEAQLNARIPRPEITTIGGGTVEAPPHMPKPRSSVTGQHDQSAAQKMPPPRRTRPERLEAPRNGILRSMSNGSVQRQTSRASDDYNAGSLSPHLQPMSPTRGFKPRADAAGYIESEPVTPTEHSGHMAVSMGRATEKRRSISENSYLVPDLRRVSQASSTMLDLDNMVEDEGRRHVLKRWWKKRNTVYELVDTEDTFVNDMQLIVNCYGAEWTEETGMSRDDFDIIFEGIGAVLAVAKALLNQLYAHVEQVFTEELLDFETDRTQVGRVFADDMDNLISAYSMYYYNQEYSISRLLQVQQRPAVAAWLDAKRSEVVQSSNAWDLGSLLVKPVQRFLKYPLMLSRIREYTESQVDDYKWLKYATRRILEAADEINENIKERPSVSEPGTPGGGGIGSGASFSGESFNIGSSDTDGKTVVPSTDTNKSTFTKKLQKRAQKVAASIF